MGGPPLAIVVLLAVAGCGLWLGRDYLAGGGRKPMVLGAHILLGLAAFETLIVLMHGLDEGPARTLGQAAMGLMALALGLGLAGPVFVKDSRPRRNAMLAGHAGVGAAGILVGIAWAAGL